METEILLYCITAIVSALGVKEVWAVWKKKIDLKHHSSTLQEFTKDKITSKVIEELKARIRELEHKVDELLEVNKECAIHLARLEERILLSASKNSKRKRKKPPVEKQN